MERSMRKLATLLLVSTAITLSACAYEYGQEYGARTPYYYDGYYDNFYGPAYGGYWGADGFFYFLQGPGHSYQRDSGRHFRRDHSDGFQPFHLRDPGDHEHHERPGPHPGQPPGPSGPHPDH